MNFNSFTELARMRRSIRKFKPDQLTDETIKKIVEAGSLAPSGFNCQLWEFVVIRDKELREAITTVIKEATGAGQEGQAPPKKGMTGFASAPAFILLYGDPRVRKFAPPHVRREDSYWEFIKSASLACAFEHMALEAASLGLGSMWVSVFHRMQGVDQKTRKLLNIPDYLELFEMMAVGYPNMEVSPKKLWPLEKLVHWDRCHDGEFRTEREYDEWFGGRKLSRSK